MPRLTMFQVHIDSSYLLGADLRNFREPIARFLEKHGNPIQYLTLMGRRGGIAPDICELPRVCPDLCFLKVTFDDNSWLVDRSPSHPTLETLAVYESQRKSIGEYYPRLQRTKKFKDIIPQMFPKLRKAEIRWDSTDDTFFRKGKRITRVTTTFKVGIGPINYDTEIKALVKGDDWK